MGGKLSRQGDLTSLLLFCSKNHGVEGFSDANERHSHTACLCYRIPDYLVE